MDVTRSSCTHLGQNDAVTDGGHEEGDDDGEVTRLLNGCEHTSQRSQEQ